jgi:hypothetical protein
LPLPLPLLLPLLLLLPSTSDPKFQNLGGTRPV